MRLQHAVTYYRDGFVKLPFDTSGIPDFDDHVDRGYEWISKYAGTVDMRPNPVVAFPELIEVLRTNDIPTMLELHLNTSDVTLVHCQVRREVDACGLSYMPMHRDTYFTQTGVVGNCPPVHKLIVYPCTRDEHANTTAVTVPRRGRLRVVRGSHRMMLDREDMDVSSVMQAGLHMKVDVIEGSDTSALLFNTAILHDVMPCDMSLRIIYSFATNMQYRDVYASNEVHRIVHDMYEAIK